MILVFGKTGQVARELALLPDVQCLGREDADLGDPVHCAAIIALSDASAVINAAAWTDVDKTETQEADGMVINAHAPTAMAQAAATRGLPFVHISTDYVFAGTGHEPWRPNDPVDPQNAYGRTKLRGEQGVQRAGGPHAILRTSWVISAHGHNFVKTMLRLGRQCETLNVVTDQIGGPTGAREIAAACHTIATQLQINPEKSGIYHFSGAPEISWAGLAVEVFSRAGISCDVTAVPSSDYPTPTIRPLNSRLNCQTTKDTFDIFQPDWRATLSHIINDLDTAS